MKINVKKLNSLQCLVRATAAISQN